MTLNPSLRRSANVKTAMERDVCRVSAHGVCGGDAGGPPRANQAASR